MVFRRAEAKASQAKKKIASRYMRDTQIMREMSRHQVPKFKRSVTVTVHKKKRFGSPETKEERFH